MKTPKLSKRKRQRIITALKIAAAAYDDLAEAYRKAGFDICAQEASRKAEELRAQA